MINDDYDYYPNAMMIDDYIQLARIIMCSKVARRIRKL